MPLGASPGGGLVVLDGVARARIAVGAAEVEEVGGAVRKKHTSGGERRGHTSGDVQASADLPCRAGGGAGVEPGGKGVGVSGRGPGGMGLGVLAFGEDGGVVWALASEEVTNR